MVFAQLIQLLTAALLACTLSAPSLGARNPGDLDILTGHYPRAFFFRATEGAYNQRTYPTYASWETQFNRLQGIMGKCLDEECLGREPRNAEFFTRFKKQHPNQVVLLHFNGNARDPRYHTEKYFSGHWIYRRAVAITQDVPAQEGESEIHVGDASAFRVNAGRYKTSNDDIALFGVTDVGKHDWYHCEQVQLLSIDLRANTIRVKRGCYGTQPLAFQAGHSRAAAHQVEGPWGRNNNLLWYYNYSVGCPRDKNGQACSDLLVEDLATWFGTGGKLAAFDGLEFDVMFNETHGDTDGDGNEDDGVHGGINEYGIGMVQFATKLRCRMGDTFIIQGDGALGPGGIRSQRAWGILNGIESEGWPNLDDWEISDWSGGLNRHRFWQANARSPAFNYVNHKWNQPVPGEPGARTNPKVPFSRHRLVFAACQLMDAATCYSFAPPRDPDGQFGVWDELRCGTNNRPGWLGAPEGPAVSLANEQPDLLAGKGHGSELVSRFSGPVVTRVMESGVQVIPKDTSHSELRFTVKSIPTHGKDLCVIVTMRAEPRAGYPASMARFCQVGASGGLIDLMTGKPIATGIKLRGAKNEQPLDQTTGAQVQNRPRELRGKKLATYFVHPPYRNGVGYTFWTKETEVPSESVLAFSIGMGEKSPERSDGVSFEVYAAEVINDTVSSYRRIFQSVTKQDRWIPQRVPLQQWAGKRVRFKFVADCGPNDNATTDHAHWGAVRIVPAGQAADRITERKQYMTWLNSKPFQSTFYYQHVNSDQVDLAFTIEGPEPVVIEEITVHAAADAAYRLFQHGIVLANPSHRPFAFDLSKLSPGRKYRRLRGTQTQDPRTNNGQIAGSTVTLGDQDGLFLERIK